MTKKTKRIIILWGTLPFCGLIWAYWFISACAAKLYYHAPTPQLMSLIKVIPSLVFDRLDLDFLFFETPAELADDIFAATQMVMIHVRYYHHIFGLAPQGQGPLYDYFPYFTAIALIASVISVVYRLQLGLTEADKNDKHIRGAVRLDADKFIRRVHKVVKDPVISVPTIAGNLTLSGKRMAEHFLILGATGTGKSQLLYNFMSSALNGHRRLIIIDRKGEFWSHFSRAQDTLFHPFDTRSAAWNLFNEIQFPVGHLAQMPDDITAIADVLFGVLAPKPGQDPFWANAGAEVFSSACALMCLRGTTTTEALCLFLRQPLPEVIKGFQTLPPPLAKGLAVLGVDPTSKTALSIMTTVSVKIRQLDCFTGHEGTWSARDWINSDGGNLYISTAGKNDTSYTSIVSLLIDLIAREVKEFPEVHATNLVFLIDEFGALPPIQSIVYLLTQARSKGVSVILANQSYASISAAYGAKSAQNIFMNCKSRFIFSVPEPGDAEFASKSFGDAEVLRHNAGSNESSGTLLSVGNNREGTSESQQITLDRAILPATLINLPTGSAAVRLPDMVPYCSVLQFRQLKQQEPVAEEYVPIPQDMIAASDVAAQQPHAAETGPEQAPSPQPTVPENQEQAPSPEPTVPEQQATAADPEPSPEPTAPENPDPAPPEPPAAPKKRFFVLSFSSNI